MGRLKEFRPGGAAAQPNRLGSLVLPERTRTQDRLTLSPWRAWYSTSRWQRLRWQVLAEALFTCVMCGRIEGNSRLLVADHIRPHRGDEALFWDRANLQCLCKACHDTTKQRQERAGLAP